ncbi:MAG: TM0106 family RecB-like putative nuclease [Acidobacteriota bacterium]
MKLRNNQWSYSPTDLATFLRCEHAVTVSRQVELGLLKRVPIRASNPHTDLLARHGREHEAQYVQSLRDEGTDIVEIPRANTSTSEAREMTIAAMKDGAEVIVQGLLTDGTWLGYADILERVAKPSRLGDWSYEAADTKLARTVHPHVVLQLGVYSDLLQTIQGVAPDWMHVILGDNRRETLKRSDLEAYIRHVRTRFLQDVAANKETEPYPVSFCALCRWNLHCYYQWVETDHLSLVADIRRDQVKRLTRYGISTLTILGESDPRTSVPEVAPPTFEKLANQARLQLQHKQTGMHAYEFLDPEDRRGFQRLPMSSPGDLFFDVEADPFEDLIYLFGLELRPEHDFIRRGSSGFPQPTSRFTSHPHYLPFWAHNATAEKQAFNEVMDFIVNTLEHHPDAHVYHYGPADVIALKRLMGTHATCEEELDDLLRRQVFVDLLGVVRQSIRISHPSYSLKKVETFYMDRQSEGVIDAGGAIVAYEEWLVSQDDATLKEIEEYNREDCASTVGLQRWLLELREELERKPGLTLAWLQAREPEKTSEEEEAEKLESDDVSRALLEGLPDDAAIWNEGQRARWTLANLLHYHRREAKPGWWEYFNRLTQTPEELVEDKESIGVLEPTGEVVRVKKSKAIQFRYPPQQHKLSRGDSVRDSENLDDKGYARSAGTIYEIDDAEGTLWLKRGPGMNDQPLPRAIIPNGPIDDQTIRDALRRFAQTIVDSSFEAAPYAAARDILLRRPPLIRSHDRGQPLQTGHLTAEQIVDIAGNLEQSALFIQGPPGSGKTYRGAKIIVSLLAAGKRVGVSATSHKAIENLLREVERQADVTGVHFMGLKHSSSVELAYRSELSTPLIHDTTQKAKEFPNEKRWDEQDSDIRLVAGTPWCFSSADHDTRFDVLVIDEAGQMALATALAVSTAARSVILLGDPLQLAQVSQGTHPEGCGASVLEHLLGGDATIPPERGIFLERSRRMHPSVCRFISEVVYDGRLDSEPECANNRLALMDNGRFASAGLSYLPVEHTGNAQDSPEEAEAIADAVAELLRGTTLSLWKWSASSAVTRNLEQNDMMVVTPYNAQVRKIRQTLAGRGLSAVRVGTVDKFQGQEAPVVFFSMATSSGEDIPRSVDFLFSRNRLNVAISRAQCLAVLVTSPKLLDVHCNTIEQMKLVNSLCRFVEMAGARDA